MKLFIIAQIKKAAILALFALFFFAAGFLARDKGITFSRQEDFPKVTISRELPESKKTINFSLFWEVWDRLQKDYFLKEKIDPAELVYGAIKGMVASVGDPYTVFLSPNEQKRTIEDLQGSFEGIGIQIGFKGSQLAVIAPLPGTPADIAGIKAGDFIVGIKDEKRKIDKGTMGISLPDAVDAIRGSAGTEVTLTLTRNGVDKPLEINVKRAKIDVPSVELSFVGDKKDIAHLKLRQFGEQSFKEWEKKVNEVTGKCKPKNRCSVILDLRNNPGGFLNGAVFFASEFVPSGVVVIQESSRGEKTNLSVSRRGKLLDSELVVLVNKGSASASEIVAGALRDHNRAKIIGETTFGKGTIQEAQELEGGAGLHITTARWLTPGEVWIDQKGIEPDIKIEDKAETEEDEQLEKAIEELVD